MRPGDQFADGPQETLTGGNVNASVVRIGQTVRRVAGRWSPQVQALLTHLEAVGFDAAPRFLGVDGTGREVLTFMPGQAGLPGDMYETTAAMVSAAKLLRSYHDATLGLPHDPAGWARADPDPAQREVICHNDAAPYNMVFENGRAIGLIDFDLAGPGPRLRDLAYLAIWCVPLMFGPGAVGDEAGELGRADLAAGCPRLRRIAAAYGTSDLPGLILHSDSMLAHLADADAMLAMIGPNATDRLKADGHLAYWQAQSAAFRQVLPVLLRTIGQEQG